jgi:quercetin dioxygenase-like cupin family protein
MKEIVKNEKYKVIKVEFAAGTNMPRHLATSEAFVIVESGEALLVYKGETYELGPGSSEAIPTHEPHLLKVISDFKAFIILANDAEISYVVE